VFCAQKGGKMGEKCEVTKMEKGEQKKENGKDGLLRKMTNYS
jgi:hypothetical protein